MRYQCDMHFVTPQPYVHRTRCSRPALFAGERDAGSGVEMFFFCQYHAPSDWGMFDVVYRIKDDELAETGISKENRLRAIAGALKTEKPPDDWGKVTPRDFAKEAVNRHNEKKYDEAFMRSMRIKW